MLTLNQSFQNVKIVCDDAMMNKAQRNAVDESLNNIAGALQAHEVMLQAAKETDKKRSVDEPLLESEPQPLRGPTPERKNE